MAKHRDDDEMMMYKSTEDATKKGVFRSYVGRGSRSARNVLGGVEGGVSTAYGQWP
jgi:hypothetical protein